MGETKPSKASPAPTLQASELRDLRVLFIHPDQAVGDEFETRAEEALPRVNFFSAATLSVARDLLKRHECQLAIYSDGIEGKDFVFTQIELKNAHRGVRMIPLIGIPTIEQLNAQRRTGGIHSFGKKEDANSFSAIQAMILNFARDMAKSQPGLAEHLEYGRTLQKFLFARDAAALDSKTASRKILEGLMVDYDWNPSDSLGIITAEMVYAPDIAATSYARLLESDKYQLKGWLEQTSSWMAPGSKPTGAAGMLITLSNYVSWKLADGMSTESVISSVLQRPHFLLHPSVRVLKRDTLALVIDATRSDGIAPSTSVRNAG